jgi:hypothetical protein
MEGDQRHQRSQRHSSGKTGHFEEDHEITKVMTPPPFALTASPVSPPNDSGASDESEEFAENSFLKEQESASAPPDESPNGLPKELRLQMEDSLGHDFSTVQIVRDSQEALASGAEAFAAGDTLHFAPGFYNPASAEGRALIGHELAHIVQQREGRVQASSEVNGMPLNDDHGLESEAASLGAKAAENNIAGKSKEAERKMDGLQKAGNVSLRVGKKVMQRNIFSNAWDWGKKAVAGVADFAGKAIGGVAKVANKALGAVGNFVGNAAKTVAGAAWGGINNLADLLGFDLPDNTTEALVAIASALGSALFFPFKALIPKAVSGTLDMISKVWDFFDKIAEKGKEVIEAIRSWMQTRIDAVEAKAKEKLEEQGVPESHWDGVMSYLQPMLESMAANWWDAIVEGLWELIWPIPGVWADIQGIGEQILVAGGHLWHLRFSKFGEAITQVWAKLNAILGRLMGWLTVAMVAGGAIIGTLGGPLGTAGGAWAGFELAGAIGLGVLLSTAACELTIIATSRAGLHSLEDAETDETKALENELYYENIASGILTLSLLLVMVLIAAAAVKFAKAIVGKVKGMFKRPPLKTRGKRRYRPKKANENKKGRLRNREKDKTTEPIEEGPKTTEEPKHVVDYTKTGLSAQAEADLTALCKRLKMKGEDIQKIIAQFKKHPGGEDLLNRIVNGRYADFEGFDKVLSTFKQGPKVEPDLVAKTVQTLDGADELIKQGYDEIFFERSTDKFGFDADIGAEPKIGIVNTESNSIVVQLKFVQNNKGVASNVTKGCSQVVNAPKGFRKLVDIQVKNGNYSDFMLENRNVGIESIHQTFPDTEIRIKFADGGIFQIK